MRRFTALIAAILFSLSITVHAFGFGIDGHHSNPEWDGAQTLILLENNKSNGIESATVEYFVDREEQAIYMCFVCINGNSSVNSNKAGIIFEIDGENKVEIGINGVEGSLDSELYNFEAAMHINEISDITAEAKLTVKRGLPDIFYVTVSFKDSNGIASNYRQLKIITAQENTTNIQTENTPKPAQAQKNTPKSNKAEKFSEIKTTTYNKSATTDFAETSGSAKINTEPYTLLKSETDSASVNKYKAIIITASVVALFGLATWGALGGKKKTKQ